MGSHIKMKNRPASYYPVDTYYQSNEAKLDLSVESLRILNDRLQETDRPKELIFDDFIIQPMLGIQKILSNIVWVSKPRLTNHN